MSSLALIYLWASIQANNELLEYTESNDSNTKVFEKFKEELDWINIVYDIKELKEKVNYLLQKDPDFENACNFNPNLRQSLNVPEENDKNRASRVENYKYSEVNREESKHLQNMGKKAYF